jgi:hypothetical protein
MRFIAVALLAALIITPVLMTACVRPVFDEDGVGVVIEPLASLTRVKEGERIGREALDKITESIQLLADGQAALALKMQEEAIAMQAEQAKALAEGQQQIRAIEQAILDAKDESTIDWTTVILGALGVGGLAGGGTYAATNGKRKKVAELEAMLAELKRETTPA